MAVMRTRAMATLKTRAWRGWVELAGDVNWQDYGGMWGYRAGESHVYYVIRHENMLDHMSEAALAESGMLVHLSTVYRVDLATTPQERIDSALQCCGLELADVLTRDHANWAIVECLVSYGAAAPMGDFPSTHPDRARAAARREVERLVADDEYTEERLARPVNALGSSAAEYAAGDFQSAMARGVYAGNPSARLVAKMHGVDQNVIDDVRPDDWLPYLMGYMAGKGGHPAETDPDVAPEYHYGYERGKRVAAGEAPQPGWIK